MCTSSECRARIKNVRRDNAFELRGVCCEANIMRFTEQRKKMEEEEWEG